MIVMNTKEIGEFLVRRYTEEDFCFSEQGAKSLPASIEKIDEKILHKLFLTAITCGDCQIVLGAVCWSYWLTGNILLGFSLRDGKRLLSITRQGGFVHPIFKLENNGYFCGAFYNVVGALFSEGSRPLKTELYILKTRQFDVAWDTSVLLKEIKTAFSIVEKEGKKIRWN